MASDRKAHDIVLPEVRKPAGYGRLVMVIALGESARELWFQHEDEPEIIRAIQVQVAPAADKPITITTRAKRERAAFKL